MPKNTNTKPTRVYPSGRGRVPVVDVKRLEAFADLVTKVRESESALSEATKQFESAKDSLWRYLESWNTHSFRDENGDEWSLRRKTKDGPIAIFKKKNHAQ